MQNPQIDEYIANFPKETQEVLTKIRSIINKVSQDIEEVISYNMPTFRLGERQVYFAGWKKHIAFYPVPDGNLELFEELKPFVSETSTLKFMLNKPIPYDLIEKLVKYQLLEAPIKEKY